MIRCYLYSIEGITFSKHTFDRNKRNGSKNHDLVELLSRCVSNSTLDFQPSPFLATRIRDLEFVKDSRVEWSFSQ